MIIPFLALAMLGVSYGHWSEKLTIIGTITMGENCILIGSYKVLTPVGYDENRSIIDELAYDKQSLVLTCSNVSCCWNIIVGLKIHNVGTLPHTVTKPLWNIGEGDFEIETFLYGPYKAGYESVDVWPHMNYGDPLPPSHGSAIETMPGQTVIIWMKLHFTCEDPDLVLETMVLEVTLE